VPQVGRLRYLEALPGGGRPRGTLLLIHAFPLNALMWEPQRSLSEGGWHVIAPDLRQFGGANDDPPASSMGDYAADLIDLLDALHVEEAVVAGLSLGGYVAFELLRRAPTYVRALVLADTRAEADTEEGIAGRRRMLDLVNTKGTASVADEMVPKLLAESTRAERPGVADHVRSIVLANSAGAIAGAIHAMMTRPDSTPLLPTVHCPTLIVVGRHDTLTPPPLSERMRDAISGSELALIDRAGHLSNVEQPSAFNEVVGRFLQYRV
jgi:pimeloyl-ACP methyl ester carboxylesterase